MITFDGDRSKKLVWFAKKKMKAIRDMDLPSSALKVNGFLVKVYQLSKSLFGGRITAPMGVVVLYSNYDGLQVLKGDYWKGSIDSRVDYNLLSRGGLTYAVLPYLPADDLIAAGYSMHQLIPNEHTVYGVDAVPVPGVHGVPTGEAFWIGYNCIRRIVGEGYGAPGSGYEDLVNYTDDVSLNFYSSDGSNLGGRNEIYAESYPGNPVFTIEDWGSMYPLPSSEDMRYVSCKWQDAYPRFTIYNDPAPSPSFYSVSAVIKQCNTAGVEYDLFFLSVQASWMPSGLVTEMLLSNAGAQPMGGFVYCNEIDGDPVLMQMIDLTGTRPVTNPLGGPDIDWLNDPANSADEHWKLSLHFYIRGDDWVWSISSDQFMPLLDSMVQDPSPPPGSLPSEDWGNAQEMLAKLISRPVFNSTVPYDTVMFNDENGDVFTWSRWYGSFRFYRVGAIGVGNTAGIEQISDLDVGTAVGTDGDRPTITHAGDGLYLMVSERLVPALSVLSIDIGDPFGGGWTNVPLHGDTPDGANSLVYIRPVRVALNDLVLIGVVKNSVGDYYLTILFYKDSIGEWQRLSKLPTVPFNVLPGSAATTDHENWCVGLFGDGVLAGEINSYLTQHPIMPQMSVPYDYTDYDPYRV